MQTVHRRGRAWEHAFAEHAKQADSNASNRRSSSNLGLRLGSVAASARPVFSEGAASVPVPINPSTAVNAVMVADMRELRSVCTAGISDPFCVEFCVDTAVNHSSRSVACALRAS
jgi:hypothetical protein